MAETDLHAMNGGVFSDIPKTHAMETRDKTAIWRVPAIKNGHSFISKFACKCYTTGNALRDIG